MMRRKVLNRLSPSILAICVTGAFLLACDHPSRVDIEGGVVPTFKVFGRGRIEVISVNGPDFRNPKSGEAGSRYMKPYWQIAPTGEFDIQQLENGGGLVYGQVPTGFRQVFPEPGTAPQPLLTDELFTFDLRVANGTGAGVRFVIHNGKAAVEGS